MRETLDFLVVNAQEAVQKTYYPLLCIRLYPPCTPASRRRKGLKKARSLVNSLELSASCVGLRFAEKVAATPELTSAKEEKSSVEVKIVKRKKNREMIVYKLQSIHPEPAPSRSAAAIHPVRPSLSRAQLPSWHLGSLVGAKLSRLLLARSELSQSKEISLPNALPLSSIVFPVRAS